MEDTIEEIIQTEPREKKKEGYSDRILNPKQNK